MTSTNTILLGVLVVVATLLASVAQAGAPPGPETVHNDAGFIKVDGGKRSLFYWYFESRSDPKNDPFVLWMSGGPGCSGQLAMFGENGPYIVQEDLSLKLNPHSWNSNATVLWIDQPAGAGFSTGPFITNEDQMAQDMADFFDGFFAKYKAQGRDYTKLDFHVVGESYAGHYVPALSAKLVKDGKVNFKGAAIGNGLTDPQVQFKYYWQYLQQYNSKGPGGSIVKNSSIGIMRAADGACNALIAACNKAGTNTTKYLACVNAYVVCAASQLTPVQLSGINVYDVREKCNPALPLCYNFTLITDYLNQPAVKQALGVTKKWADCNRLVDMTLVYAGDWMLNFQQDIEAVLDAGHRVLIYAGEYDFMCVQTQAGVAGGGGGGGGVAVAAVLLLLLLPFAFAFCFPNRPRPCVLTECNCVPPYFKQKKHPSYFSVPPTPTPYRCNWLGNYQWTQTFDWTGHDAFAAATMKPWAGPAGGNADGAMATAAAGSFKAAKGLTFLKVFNAGHMVPRDQPENSLDMLNRHLSGTPFGV